MSGNPRLRHLARAPLPVLAQVRLRRLDRAPLPVLEMELSLSTMLRRFKQRCYH